jgi:hypothetical protein
MISSIAEFESDEGNPIEKLPFKKIPIPIPNKSTPA